jgi:hypothetical protein
VRASRSSGGCVSAGNVGVREGVLADVVGLLGVKAEHAQQIFGYLIGGCRVVAIGMVVH